MDLYLSPDKSMCSAYAREKERCEDIITCFKTGQIQVNNIEEDGRGGKIKKDRSIFTKAGTKYKCDKSGT
jgi:hypothetical protein